MKKIIVAILAFLYLGISSGVAMEIHYCMGKKAGVELFGSDNDKCGKCGMKSKKSGCCNDEYKFYKLKDSHKTVFNDFSFETPVAIVVNTFHVYDQSIVNDVFTQQVNNHSPPILSGPSVNILLCTFRI